MEKPGEPRNRRSSRKRAEQAAQTLIAALLLSTASGCATFDFDQQSAPAFSPRAAARPMTVVLVQRGDTVASIARRYGLSSYAIIDANGLRAPYDLDPGRRLVLPPSTIHVVARGETLVSIARAYGVPRQDIIEANILWAPDDLQPGQRIAIPFAAPQPTSRFAASSTRKKVTVTQLAEPEREGVDPRAAGARYYALGNPRPKPGSERQRTYDDESDESAGRDLDAAYDEQPTVKRADAESSSSSRFIWPVRGKVISGYGRRGSGLHNDGINIAAEPGTSVKAADAGVVVYAGNELAGYGNLLLVRHQSGYVTAYAHNKKLLVGRGDPVKQGEAIALVGSTGDVDRPQLHFEIRKGDRAVDPSRYLSSSTASR